MRHCSGKVLLLEDNPVIALDTEALLLEIGAEGVVVADNVEQALRFIDETQFDLAVLDINLGGQTSTEVADKLVERGVPFLFITGYDKTENLVQLYPSVVIVVKPYDYSILSQAIKKTISQSN
ncbi:MAG: hypothetical protein CMK07_09325 [Ponticaulis sp.]|nr:hypothetical protein [Ponticaulis sp.]